MEIAWQIDENQCPRYKTSIYWIDSHYKFHFQYETKFSKSINFHPLWNHQTANGFQMISGWMELKLLKIFFTFSLLPVSRGYLGNYSSPVLNAIKSNFLRHWKFGICSHLLKKSFTENFSFLRSVLWISSQIVRAMYDPH